MLFYQQKNPLHIQNQVSFAQLSLDCYRLFMAEHQEITAMKEAQVPSLEPWW